MKKVKFKIGALALAMLLTSGQMNCYAASSTTSGGTGGYYTEGGSQFNGANYMTFTHCATSASLRLNGKILTVNPYNGDVITTNINKNTTGTELIVRGKAATGYNVLSIQMTHKVVKNGTWTGYTYAK